MLPHVPLARFRIHPQFAAPHWVVPNTCPPYPPDGAPWGPLLHPLLPATPQLPCLGPISLHSPTELYQFPTPARPLASLGCQAAPPGLCPSLCSLHHPVCNEDLTLPMAQAGPPGLPLGPQHNAMLHRASSLSSSPCLPNILPTPVLQACPLPPFAPVSSKPTWANLVAASHMWPLKPTFYLNYKVVPQPPSQFQVCRSHMQLRVTGVLANAGLDVSATAEHATGQLWKLMGWSPSGTD